MSLPVFPLSIFFIRPVEQSGMSCLSLLPDNVALSGGWKLTLLEPEPEPASLFFWNRLITGYLPRLLTQAPLTECACWHLYVLPRLQSCFWEVWRVRKKEPWTYSIHQFDLAAIQCLDAIICATTTQLLPLNDCVLQPRLTTFTFHLRLAEHACLQLLRAAAPQPLILIISVSSLSYWTLLRLNGLLHRKYCNSTSV